MTKRELFILLNLVSGLTSAQIQKLLAVFGGIEAIASAGVEHLQQAGFSARRAQDIASVFSDKRCLLKEELLLTEMHGVNIITWEETQYPKALRAIADPPIALYIKGNLQEGDEVAVAVVGSRRASWYGLQTAVQLGYDLALRGISVVSGLARGIDAAAHQGALKAGGRTIAILGSGLAGIYPSEHEALAKEVAKSGALISEYPMQAAPEACHFPRRNRIISGLSLGVVVVEAASRSGALITADAALEQGREVFAVPGPITAASSQGTHRLLKQGAGLITGVEDIVEALRLKPQVQPPGACGKTASTERLSGDYASVWRLLKPDEPVAMDTVVAQSGLATADVSSVLMQLELQGRIKALAGKRFIRT